ncbi:MAG: GGDEF domain-containing protein, partial [Planctomycetota bacterium]|nr:GGDEF domain-containing protein [Planctomycetota bacterium]
LLVATLTVAFGTFRRTPWTEDARMETLVQFAMLAVVAVLGVVLRREHLARRVAERADPLTGAANRTACLERLHVELERSKRTNAPLSVAFWDYDGFKQFNDSLGHIPGDDRLVGVSQVIQSRIRSYDLWARWGGDEFVLLLPDTDETAGRAVIGRLKQTLTAEFPSTGSEPPVSFSVGLLVCRRDYPTADAAIASADTLMYEAKSAGANSLVAGAWEAPTLS